MTPLEVVLDFIYDADDEALAAIDQAVRDARGVARIRRQSAAIAEFKAGDRVALSGLSPKYVNGSTGTILERRNTKFLVRLDPDVDPRAIARFGTQVRVPATALVKVES